MSQIIDTTKEPVASRYTMLGHIFGSHCERIGVVRAVAGAIPQYTIIPLLIVIHTTLTVALYQWLIAPLLGTPKVRIRIERSSAMERLRM